MNKLTDQDKHDNRQRTRAKKKRDENFRLAKNLRERCRKYTLGHREDVAACFQLIGCSPTFLREHLQNQWLPGMTWESYGSDGWQIDHIEALRWFDLTDPEQIAKACHYTNLRPMWSQANQKKGCINA